MSSLGSFPICKCRIRKNYLAELMYADNLLGMLSQVQRREGRGVLTAPH